MAGVEWLRWLTGAPYVPVQMPTRKSEPADDITLRDVINHMNHKFGVIETRLDGLDRLVALEDRVGRVETHPALTQHESIRPLRGVLPRR
jgi:hypothetical protein